MKQVNYGYNETQPTMPKNKGGRPSTEATSKKKEQFIKLIKSGATQRQISIELGINEKTAGIWAKEYREGGNRLDPMETMFNQRIKLLLNDPNASIIDIKNLVSALNDYKKGI
ncbi:helix-turn-helix domain-containing protein [Flavobacterium covae]|uniref:helix-turn-helix domain-containing protein n=1 Tax=Flavobacterium covae TaxID=2906076 RepID=UPI000745BA3A|nr:helix-turn-helix domain-containing protein [Flavobacterium covae]AMA50443.1 hypothetical protein AWN65_13730 [Flavobacterium covae]MCJ1809080.1 helix-turn-helix domain-containing protein [Flavobacterium covae]